MAKVTLSVPDDLYAKIEKYKDRLNLSELFRETVSREIEKIEEKSEIIQKLHEYLKSKLPSPDKEATRRVEIDRFTRKWGKPDYIHPDDSLGAKPPYVTLEKRIKINQDSVHANLRVFNGVRKYWIEYSPREYRPENWEKVHHIADFFKSIGFNVVEIPFLQDSIRMFVTGGDKEQARELQRRGYEYYGLFVYDREDTVFIDYREVKRP